METLELQNIAGMLEFTWSSSSLLLAREKIPLTIMQETRKRDKKMDSLTREC